MSDTARVVAFYRALESERPDALFRDPFARRLAGARGEGLARALGSLSIASSVVVQRVAVFDELIVRAVREGVDAVLNLGAGLDARPYRLPLPPALRWYDVDLPLVIAHREQALAQATPRCQVETVSLDLGARAERRAIFDRLDVAGRRVLVVSEGLLLYLPGDEVTALAADLAARPTFVLWLADLLSPMAARRMERGMTSILGPSAAALFAPPQGAAFFAPYGWHLLERRSALAEAQRLGRPAPLPWPLALVLRLWPRRGTDGTILLARSP